MLICSDGFCVVAYALALTCGQAQLIRFCFKAERRLIRSTPVSSPFTLLIYGEAALDRKADYHYIHRTYNYKRYEKTSYLCVQHIGQRCQYCAPLSSRSTASIESTFCQGFVLCISAPYQLSLILIFLIFWPYIDDSIISMTTGNSSSANDCVVHPPGGQPNHIGRGLKPFKVLSLSQYLATHHDFGTSISRYA
jgi:hypothetical protein